MTQQVLSYPAKILSEEQRQYYFDKGCVRVEGLVSDNWLQRLRQASLEMVAKSNGVSKSNEVFILEEGHKFNQPRLKRLNSPATHHPEFWEFAARSTIADAVSDVVGPNVRFYHSKLNYKWAGGGQSFDWHQVKRGRILTIAQLLSAYS